VTEQSTPPPADEPTDPRRPDYEDFRDEDGVVNWLAFRAAVAAYDPDTQSE
jgi:hypothetical protein